MSFLNKLFAAVLILASTVVLWFSIAALFSKEEIVVSKQEIQSDRGITQTKEDVAADTQKSKGADTKRTGIVDTRKNEVVNTTDSSKILEEVEGILSKVAEPAKKEIVAPTPLQVLMQREPPTILLDREKIFTETNQERARRGLPLLLSSNRLDWAAALKLQDMFVRQYFSHVSPLGEGPADWTKRAGYSYIAIGENLALGNFKSEAELVRAWMNSPGHRANILNPKFREIGIAAGKGKFKNETVWIAVQIFGKPLSDCNLPDNNLRTAIEDLKQKLLTLKTEVETLRGEIEIFQPHNRREVELYNQKVEFYNSLVSKYNSLLESVKILIGEYNNQVNAFNVCATS